MQVLHISAECYPAAKAGGLGDVVGALPKYLNQAGVETSAVIPKYHSKWLLKQQYKTVFEGVLRLHHDYIPFAIEEVIGADLGFSLFVANIPGKFDRPGVYADPNGGWYSDEVERSLCFQNAVLLWVRQFWHKPLVLHCHDHHTGLIPFMVKYCPEFKSLADIPTVFTIHNGEYHGAMSWRNMHLLPYFEAHARGLLDWKNTINPLATAIKCAWKVTTVSPSYMEELREKSNGLEVLMNNERAKSVGILNGIDAQVWNPATDYYIHAHLHDNDVSTFKAANKAVLAQRFNINPDLPIITFIGRLVKEKGADLIPDTIRSFFHYGHKANFIILGTGEKHLENEFRQLRQHIAGYVDVSLEYNEGLAHQLYAGSDFLLMPSRVEPCGLNQMYALRYGTVPIVRSVGGLKDSVFDIGEPDDWGRGIRFDNFTIDDALVACYRASKVYENSDYLAQLRTRIMNLDFSWEQSAQSYVSVYQDLVNK